MYIPGLQIWTRICQDGPQTQRHHIPLPPVCTDDQPCPPLWRTPCGGLGRDGGKLSHYSNYSCYYLDTIPPTLFYLPFSSLSLFCLSLSPPLSLSSSSSLSSSLTLFHFPLFSHHTHTHRERERERERERRKKHGDYIPPLFTTSLRSVGATYS